MKEAVTEVIDTLTLKDFHGALQKLFKWYNRCIAAGGAYFEEDYSFMCVLSIKVLIRKSLETYLMILVRKNVYLCITTYIIINKYIFLFVFFYIYRYIHVCIYVYIFVWVCIYICV